MEGKASLSGVGSTTLLTFRHSMESTPCILGMVYPGDLLYLCLRQGLEGSKVDPEVSLKGLIHRLLKNNYCVQRQGRFSSGMPFASYDTRIQGLHFISRLPFPCSTPKGPAELVPALPPHSGPCLPVQLSPGIQVPAPQAAGQQPASDDS